MSTEPATMNWRNYVGRFSVELVPDCTRQALLPRDPSGLFAEID
ncbi:MAG: hypothetical protein ACHRXM_26470 [Isosphaerales bacterium]